MNPSSPVKSRLLNSWILGSATQFKFFPLFWDSQNCIIGFNIVHFHRIQADSVKIRTNLLLQWNFEVEVLSRFKSCLAVKVVVRTCFIIVPFGESTQPLGPLCLWQCLKQGVSQDECVCGGTWEERPSDTSYGQEGQSLGWEGRTVFTPNLFNCKGWLAIAMLTPLSLFISLLWMSK